MRILKLVIWDLDETLLAGILEEGDADTDPDALRAMRKLDEHGVLQAVATQNRNELALSAFDERAWTELFVRVEADLRPKRGKVARILDELGTSPLDTAFVDNDPFERASIGVQFPGITTWSVADLAAHLAVMDDTGQSEESRRRPLMYRQEQARADQERIALDYEQFLKSCDIAISIRPYEPADGPRARELLTRTHRMNLGTLPLDDALRLLDSSNGHRTLVAEVKDVYGDMGRCGIVTLAPGADRGTVIESLAISCRTRARGLALALLVGLLRHPSLNTPRFVCRYVRTDANMPLRMLLLSAGFKPQPATDGLVLASERLAAIAQPDWVTVAYPSRSAATA